MAIQPLPTSYHGHKFRSKLEAKWARVFDLLGIAWEYEPEARQTDHGGYLPDFYLPRMKGGTWLEIKPSDRRVAPEDPRWIEFVLQRKQPLVIAFGLPDPYTGTASLEVEPGVCWKIFPSAETDFDYRLTLCAVCGAAGFEFEGRGARACPTRLACYGREDADRGHNPNDPRIVAALIEARAAFTGADHIGGRTIDDATALRLAQVLIERTADGSAPRAHLGTMGLAPADEQAVMQQWGRLLEADEA